MEFNVVTRRSTVFTTASLMNKTSSSSSVTTVSDEQASQPYLATKMKYNNDTKSVTFERFRVLSCPDGISVEIASFDLNEPSTTLELLRERPTYCGVRLTSSK